MSVPLNMGQVAYALAGHDPEVSNELTTGLRREMGLTRPEFARLVGLSERSIATRERGDEKLAEASRRKIIETGRLYAKLRGSFPSPEKLATWMRSPHPAFGNSKPLQVIERGEIDRIWMMIHRIESGMTS